MSQIHFLSPWNTHNMIFGKYHWTEMLDLSILNIGGGGRGSHFLNLFFLFRISVWKRSAPQEYSHYNLVEFVLQKFLCFDTGDWYKEIHLFRIFWPFFYFSTEGGLFWGGLLIFDGLFAKCALSLSLVYSSIFTAKLLCHGWLYHPAT